MLESESVLLQRFAATGDAEAFSEIVRRHAGMVYGTSIRVLSDADLAADATQETFFQLLQNASEITSSVSGWLHRVATHKAVDVIRRDSSRRKREARYAADRTIDAQKWQDISPYVDEALDELDAETRGLLIGHFFNGRTMTEIAAAGKLSQPTVSRRIESGIERLAEKLKDRGIIAAAAALTGFLGANAVEAAPAMVLSELGKMALVGSASATVAGSATAAIGSTAAKAAATAAIAGVKAKIITTAAAVVIAGTGAVITYNLVTNRDKPAEPVETVETVETVRQDKGTQSSPGTSVARAGGNSTNEMSKEEFEKWFFGEIVDEEAADSADTPQPMGGFAGGGAQIQNTQPPEEPSQPAARFGGMMGMGGYGGMARGSYGGMFVARFDTPEATVSSFVQVLSMRDMNQISKCFVEGAPNVENLRRTIQDPQDAEDLQMKILLESIGPPIEIVKTVEERNGLGVIWLSTVHAEFTLGDMTFIPGDKFELDATLVKIGDEWKIAGM